MKREDSPTGLRFMLINDRELNPRKRYNPDTLGKPDGNRLIPRYTDQETPRWESHGKGR